jgi:hypothetical protein
MFRNTLNILDNFGRLRTELDGVDEQSLVCGRYIKSCEDDFGGLREENEETRHAMTGHLGKCNEHRLQLCETLYFVRSSHDPSGILQDD